MAYSKIGLLKEGKVPPDKRVTLTPRQCAELMADHASFDIQVQRSPHRAFTDDEYAEAGVELSDDLRDRELLIGVKEVPIEELRKGGHYLFFSHTIKKQPHNKKLLRAVLDKGITLLDHELLTDENGNRVIAFGRYAGIVGAYNALRGWHHLHALKELKPAHACHDRVEMEAQLEDLQIPSQTKILLTGSGRVGQGALEVLKEAGFHEVEPADFLSNNVTGHCFAVLETEDMYVRDDGKPFDKRAFYKDPRAHRSIVGHYAKVADLYLACHFWDARGPEILDRAAIEQLGQRLKVIADISCDVNGPIASTIRATTIAEPFYGYHKTQHQECPVGTEGSILVMAVDNLPCELPRDASRSFGQQFMGSVASSMLNGDAPGMLDRATIVRKGKLTERFSYLQDWVDEP